MIIEIIAFVAALWAMFCWGALFGLELSGPAASAAGPRLVVPHRPRHCDIAANENAIAGEVTRVECKRASA